MIYLFAGHHIRRGVGTGARTAKYDETLLASELRNMIASALRSKGVSVWTDRDDVEQASQIAQVLTQIKRQDIVVDLHFNASASRLAGGVEVFVPTEPSSFNITLAQSFANETARHMKSQLRRSKHSELPLGVKYHTETQHGEKGLLLIRALKRRCKAICLIEVAFITNESEMSRYQEVKSNIAQAYADTLFAYQANNEARS